MPDERRGETRVNRSLTIGKSGGNVSQVFHNKINRHNRDLANIPNRQSGNLGGRMSKQFSLPAGGTDRPSL